jgi:ubiquinol-cytochrome c reductase iron-sulfur subunit
VDRLAGAGQVSRRRGPSETRRFGAWITLCFLASAGASIGLTVLYAFGGQPQLEGLLIFVALGGIAIGFVLWAKHLMPNREVVEERPSMRSSEDEREAFAADFFSSGEAIKRRSFLGRALVAALGALGIAAVFPIRSLGPGPGKTLFRTSWRRGSRVVASDGTAVTASDLPVGGILTVFPEGHVGEADAQTVLLRLQPGTFATLPGRETWSPQGFLAFSKICTHAGCPVGLFEQATNQLFCPCHQSVFDVTDGARPISGPAARPLPQLPLQIDATGQLRSQSDFLEPVGPGFWNDGGNHRQSEEGGTRNQPPPQP